MKKITLITLFISTVGGFNVAAQPEKGSWMIGADIQNSPTFKAGKFVSNKLLLSANIMPVANFNRLYSNMYLNVSSGLRYYFASKKGIQAQKMYPIAEVDLGVGYQIGKMNGNFMTSMGVDVSAGAGAGLEYFVNDRISVNGLLKASTYSIGRGASSQANLYVRPTVGAQIYFRGKKKHDKLEGK